MITQLEFDLDGDGGIVVAFSSEATITTVMQTFNAFQRNSYVVRVWFPDGHVILQALPKGAAATGSPYQYANEALLRANEAREQGQTLVVWED